MESLISAYGTGEDEDEHWTQQQPLKRKAEEAFVAERKRATDSSLSSSGIKARIATCAFIGPPKLPAARSSLGPPLQSSVPLPLGRYVSKREKAILSDLALSAIDVPSEQVSNGFQAKIPADVSRIVHGRELCHGGSNHRSRVSKALFVQLKAHAKAITAVQWSPTHGSLLASGGMDSVARVWDAWSKKSNSCAVRSFISHSAGVKNLHWSRDGDSILTCGFDQTSRLSDIETGVEIQVLSEDQCVNVVKFHPVQKELFLSGGSKGLIRLWDIRAGAVVKEYWKGQGQIMDVDFDKDGKFFVSSSDIADRNSSDRTIIVWDFGTQIPLSHQVYLEPYTCPCVRYHPSENVFVAQSHGNYIALFSGNRPFRMNKHKRFEGHEVSGYRIQCNFSPDGELLATGSSNGHVCIYHYRSTKLLKELNAHPQVCTDVSFHPSMPSVIASGGWEGNICVYN